MELDQKFMAFRRTVVELRSASYFDKADKAEKTLESLEQVLAQLIAEFNDIKFESTTAKNGGDRASV